MVYRTLCVIMATLVILTGCATAPAATPTTAPAKAAATTAPKAAGETPKPAATGQATAKPAASAPSGTLVSAIATFGEDTLDPILGGWATTLSNPLFEYMIDYDEKGNLKPRLADSWSMSPDGKTWTFKLHKGVKFHNGDEMTSADVVFSFERLMSKDSRNPWGAIYRRDIKSIEAPDAYTVVLNLNNPDANYPNAVAGAFVMPKKYTEEKGVDNFARNPIGTGPWKLVKFTPSQTIEYEAVGNHWYNTPAFKTLIVKNVPEESTRMAMLKRGELDIIGLALDSIDEAKANGFEIRLGSNPTQPFVIFPGTWQKTNAPVMDVRIRQALSLAINREEMGKTFFKGYGTPAARSWTAENSWGWNAAWKADPYDPQKAKQLLADAGYPNKFSDPVIPIYSYQLTGAPWLPGWTQIISGYWEAIGARTKITPIDGAQIRTMYTAKPVDPKVVGTAVSYQGAGANFSYYNAVNLYATAGNVELIREKEYDDFLLSVPKELDETKRIKLFQQAMDKAHDLYVDIMTVNVPAAYAVSNKVGAFPTPTGTLERAYESIKRK